MVCDFHSHALPKIDDGAKSLDMSIEMLKKSKEQGVTDVILTPHCYPYSQRDITDFLVKRKRAYDMLHTISDIPNLHMGCELHLTGDVTNYFDLKELCIENTNYLLLEMPTTPWNDNTIEFAYKLTLMGITPVIAHDERNFHQKQELRNLLYDLDVLIQINAPSLSMHSMRKEVDKMLKLGMGHVIGSDMHNLTSRKPCFDIAQKQIKKRYGEDCWDYFMTNAEKILNDEKISYKDFKSFKKKSLL